MRIPPVPHPWNVSTEEAIDIQRQLASRVREVPLDGAVRYVCGVDAAFSRDGRLCIAGAVVWDLAERTPVERQTAAVAPPMPCIPGLLSFRELPAVLAVLARLSREPEVIFCDGQGIAHPRRLGIASHLGVILERPTVGCAKSRLSGFFREPASERGSRTTLRDGRGEVIGTVLRTKDRVRPIFVSIGHLIDLQAADLLVLACTSGYRLPEPTRLADRLVAERKREMELEIGPSVDRSAS